MLSDLDDAMEGSNSYVKFYLDGDALSVKTSLATSISAGGSSLTLYYEGEYKTNADMTLASSSTHVHFNSDSDSFELKYVISAEWMK